MVWGIGFDPNGGNTIKLTRIGGLDTVSLTASSGGYFWSLSANQINAGLPPQVTGNWVLSVRNSCGAQSTDYAVTIQ